jgi:hypothetical protein
MADWRQIQARIRKAKASSDPPGQLAAIYERTRDAMVAFELAKLSEKSGQTDEAVRWYTAAAERFRRAQWRTKAAEALSRLGAPVPAPIGPEQPPSSAPDTVAVAKSAPASVEPTAQQPQLPLEPSGQGIEGAVAPSERPRHRRRGRRGGRGRRRGKATEAPAAPAQSAQGTPESSRTLQVRFRAAEESEEEAPEPAPQPAAGRAHPAEHAAGPAAWQVRGRAGEPALASRLAHLESQLRRLIASPLSHVDEADQAPAGPGVFILSDSDQTTYYYIEACQTLRIGVGNLLRGERGARRGESLRSRLAEHLGINESRVSKYLKEHCAVRWLQLDEGASLLAHFGIAVLRPALND